VLTSVLVATGLRVATQAPIGWAEGMAPVTLHPVGDATVSGDQNNANFGGGRKLEVDKRPTAESYLRFLVPAGLSGPAVLRLWVVDPTKNGPKVHRSDGTLDETAITWDSRLPPLMGPGVDSGVLAKNSWAEWDVTALVAGAGDVTLALLPDASDGVDFGSRESGHSPELVFPGAPVTPPTTSTSTSTTSSTTTTTTIPAGPGTAPECRPNWSEAEPINKLANGLGEMSGFAASPTHPSWGWGIRDSGNPASLYAIKPSASGAVKSQEVRAYGLRNSDWEDVAYTPGFDSGHLWVLENVGNGWTGNRWIHQFDEPDPENPPVAPLEETTTTTLPPVEPTTTTTTEPPSPPPPPAALVGSYQWAYPDTQANTETMFVFDGDLVVVSKTSPSRVYRFDGPLLPFVVNVPRYVGTLPVGNTLSVAALSVDQRTLAFSSHGKVDIYENRGDVHDLAALIANPVFHETMESDNREAGSFFPYGSCDLLLLAESKTLWKLDHR